MSESRAAKGPPPGGASGSPTARVLRDSGGGFDAACALFGGRVRASGAQMLTPPGVRVRGERSLHHVRGQPRKDGGKELEPPAAALRSERWVANESLRRCVAMTSETGCLRVYGPTRWTSSRGGFTGIPFVARRGCGRGDSFGRPAGATAIEHGRPFGDNRTSVAWSQTGPKHPAVPSRSGEGTPKRFGPPGETSSESWAARQARQRRNESIQSPREHRAVARRQRLTNATDSSVEESPEVESSAARRGDTRASVAPTARGNASR